MLSLQHVMRVRQHVTRVNTSLQHVTRVTPEHESATGMGWLQLVGSIKLLGSFAKEPYRRDYILQKRPTILSILLTVATP